MVIFTKYYQVSFGLYLEKIRVIKAGAQVIKQNTIPAGKQTGIELLIPVEHIVGFIVTHTTDRYGLILSENALNGFDKEGIVIKDITARITAKEIEVLQG